jgi:hypothetical protein
MKIEKNTVYAHKDNGRLLKVVQPRGFVCNARFPKERTMLVSTSKLQRTGLGIDAFRALD